MKRLEPRCERPRAEHDGAPVDLETKGIPGDQGSTPAMVVLERAGVRRARISLTPTGRKLLATARRPVVLRVRSRVGTSTRTSSLALR